MYRLEGIKWLVDSGVNLSIILTKHLVAVQSYYN